MTRSTASAETDAERAGVIRVVCADDAQDALALLRLQLTLLSGVEVVSAVTDGQRAVDAATRLEPDLVVLDVAMPVMDGLEAAQEIRARGVPTRILILSAFSAERMQHDALAAGADAYLEKSAEPDALMAELRRLFPTRTLVPVKGPAPPAAAPVEGTVLERRYKALLDALEEAVLVIGPDGKVRESNFAAATLLGRPTSRLLGADFATLGLSDDAGSDASREQGFTAVQATLRTGRPCSNVPVTLVRADGTSRWLLCSARPLRDGPDTGHPEVLLSLLDLTEQHVVQQELAASESRLRTALETLPDFFAIYRPARDESGQVTDLIFEFVNGAGLKVLGRKVDEAVGHGMLELLPSHVDLGLFDRYVQVLATGDTDRFDLPWFDDSGVQGAFAVTAAKMDGRLVILARDVTEERQTRAEAERLELRYRAAVDAMLDSVIIATSVRDESGRIVDFTIDYINPVAEIGGRPREELVGMLFSEAWPGARIGPTPTLDLYREVVETGEPVVRDSFRYVDYLDGQLVEAWFDLRATKLGDGFIQNFRDVTARVRAERELAERAAALARSNADLQEFSYAVGHDLGAPLQTVLGFAHLLRARLGDAVDPDVGQYLDYIESGGRRAVQMLSDLLAYSRVHTQGTPLESIDLGDVVADVEENLRGQITTSGARIYTDTLPTVRGDRTQLMQLLQNLVGNAITYVAPGVSPRVHIAAAPVADGWQVSVTDNGIGIAEPEREQAFGLFQRVGDPSAHPGSGLGLALCRRIVTRHGGRIWIDAAPNGGTTATFVLPSNPPEPDGAAAPADDPAADASGEAVRPYLPELAPGEAGSRGAPQRRPD